ncbi:F-actin-capping protein subunit beta [Parelaphostrongylus tenuis]|uniref:F-actin-capping protein subunit beta n=1 Tax=Parelaphostrongylus tenuis TaxID=148309 RepID=A0AAD5QMG1_PARTN|nr:F-actin-capping protein subunit beta [Parelaphostrongylus tenuis]
MSEQQLDCALDLMRRLPPQQCEKNLIDLIDIAPSLCDDLLGTVDQPLKVAKDRETGKEYLLCDYSRDGDSYRSPWTNTKLEIEANAAFESYRDQYFDGGISSVYFWDLDHGFAGVVLIKKNGDGSKAIQGCWDSIHVIEINERSSRQVHYKLTSTVMLWLQTNKPGSGMMNLGGSLTRQAEQDAPVNDQNTHLVNIGKMIEDQESKMRSTINEIYFGKTKKVIGDLRSVDTSQEKEKQEEIVREIRTVVAGRGNTS